jgi:tetratricopeptide (TPR) repeat protein
VRSAASLAIALAASVAAAASVAGADTAPTPWDRAKDARIGEDWELHVKVAEWLAIQGLEEPAKLQAAKSWLEEAHAETSHDVRLRFDLGEVYERLKHDERAVEVLAPALALAPDHPAAADAWIELAYAYARLDRSREEMDAYDAFLARATDVRGRATAMLNRAEASMRLGNLDDAVIGYRETILVAESISGLESLFKDDVLARWGLAVALDRSGDPTGSAKEAALAAQLDPASHGPWPVGSIIGDPVNVFFVPDYERAYYIGLGLAEHAKQAKDRRTESLLWAKTASVWQAYVRGAEGWNQSHKDRPDRWLPLARTHLARAERERERAAAEQRAKDGR